VKAAGGSNLPLLNHITAISKEGRRLQSRSTALRERFLGVHLAALVVGHCLAHRCRLAIEDGREAIDNGLGSGVVHLGKDHESARSLPQAGHQLLHLVFENAKL
jgi:hypothetical protein